VVTINSAQVLLVEAISGMAAVETVKLGFLIIAEGINNA
jgi:hypothetical protein